MSPTDHTWLSVSNAGEVPSPSLLVFPERILANIRRMIAIVGGPERLCPHVKTHKLPEIVQLQRALGIDSFKCATIAEAEMLARARAGKVLVAYQMVGPNIHRLLALTRHFQGTHFSTIVDDLSALAALAHAVHAQESHLELLVDIDCGMHRTGIPAGPEAIELFRRIAGTDGLTAGGLHVYDGHIDAGNPEARSSQAQAALAPAKKLRESLAVLGHPVPRFVVGGSPTLAIHASDKSVECSPGTALLWDAGSAAAYPDLPFVPAAVLLTRVISKPGRDRLCLDLGHKAVASEMPQPRIDLPQIPDATFISHNEEHLVLGSSRADAFHIGDALYAIPRHICPTVALHASVTVIRGGRASETWKVTARDRKLEF